MNDIEKLAHYDKMVELNNAYKKQAEGYRKLIESQEKYIQVLTASASSTVPTVPTSEPKRKRKN